MCRAALRLRVSIHAPHEGERRAATDFAQRAERFQSTLPTRGSDEYAAAQAVALQTVSIHAPHEGERPMYRSRNKNSPLFQSTLPTRGSDAAISSPSSTSSARFNPRSPRGGATKRFAYHGRAVARFNPRSPRGGATPFRICTLYALCVFQSTLPTRGSDGTLPQRLHLQRRVSIHAPHEGERPARNFFTSSSNRVSIHAPHEGERLHASSRISP